MRAGAITVQQTLTTEAASVLKHSLSLARRRGHAQVTPLHVAATLLSSRASLLRRACLKSQGALSSPHPLSSRALELCFNVALNRLPTAPGPLLHGQPSLSNALIAALKRAQAHQRRGCIEQQQQQQQQPLLAIKVELEQLILSILDDPSVSRVMREAGFSSTLVKNNLEESASVSPVFQYCYNTSTSGGVYSSPCSPNSGADVINPTSFWHTQFLNYSSEQNPLFFSPLKKVSDSDYVKEEDVKLVFEVLLRKKRRNTIIVGDSVSLTEGLVTEIMSRIERGRFRDDIPEELKSAHFIRFQFSSVPLRFMRREEVEMNLSDLKRKVDSLSLGGGGVIIFTGDLKWTVENQYDDQSWEGKYKPVDHLVAEIGRLISEYSNSNTKVWLMATADYQTYIKCQMKQPSLEIQWSLQAVSVPSGGLGLSLNATSGHESRMALSESPSQMLERKLFKSKEAVDVFTCCAECVVNYEKEATLFEQNKPSWLISQGYDYIQKENLAELRRKWSRLCHSLHQGRVQNHMDSSSLNSQRLIGKNSTYTSTHPWWPNKNSVSPDNKSISFADSVSKNIRTSGSSVPRFRRQQSCHIEFNYSDRYNKQAEEPNLNSLKDGGDKEERITLALGNILPSDSGKGERTIHEGDLSKLLQDNVPWQAEKIPSLVQVLIENTKSIKKEISTWLLIHGNDLAGKRRLALAISESVFGSADYLLYMSLSNKENKANSCCEILKRALRNHEKLVVLVEDVDCAEPQFIKFLSDGFETGKFGDTSKNECCAETLFILTKGDHKRHNSNVNKIKTSVIQMKLELDETSPRFDQKRKLDRDFSGRSKSARFSEKEVECLSIKELTRQSSPNILDLNVMAYDDDNDKSHSSILSDLTPETTNDQKNPVKFLESIKNQFVFDQEDGKMKSTILSKMKRAFEEAKQGCELQVEEAVLDELVVGYGWFLEKLFDKWVRDIFQMSLDTVKTGGKEGIIRVCLGEKNERGIQEGGGILEDGFMGSILPKKIR